MVFICFIKIILNKDLCKKKKKIYYNTYFILFISNKIAIQFLIYFFNIFVKKEKNARGRVKKTRIFFIGQP